MGPLLTIFGRRVAARQLSDEEGISMFKAVRAVRNAESADAETLSVASGLAPGEFKDGLFYAAAVHAGYPQAVGGTVGAIGDGKIIEWLLDPANQEKLLAFIKFIMTIAVLFI